MTSVKGPTIPFVNKEEPRAPKRARTDEPAQQEAKEAKKDEKCTDIVPLTFDRMPWASLRPDNAGAYFVSEYSCMLVELLNGNEGAKLLLRCTLLFNPTEAYKGSNNKPEVHVSAPRKSPQYTGSVEFSKQVAAIFKEHHMKWGEKDSAVKSDLRLVEIPKPGGPIDKEEKAAAARARALHTPYVPKTGAKMYDAKISAKWPWTKERTINTDTSGKKKGCTVLDENGIPVQDVLAFFRDAKTGAYQGRGWDVILVLRPYIWASNTRYEYGGSFKVEFMRVMGRVSNSRTYNTSAVDGSSSSSSSSSLSTSNFG